MRVQILVTVQDAKKIFPLCRGSLILQPTGTNINQTHQKAEEEIKEYTQDPNRLPTAPRARTRTNAHIIMENTQPPISQKE